ncbi:MAG TPA: hypothetical protein VMS86_13875 [Thermoanaerobaculia bacterium]|nr:hypothetical protein [Thermoanaerobaculia bacterium]
MPRPPFEIAPSPAAVAVGRDAVRNDPSSTAEKTPRENLSRPTIRYMGFRTTEDGREYVLSATGRGEQRVFVMMITHEAFATRAARFQDAPDVCFAKLARELALDADLVPGPRHVFTDEELLAYREAHGPSGTGRKGRGRRGAS